MLDIDAALARILESATPITDSEDLPLMDAWHRVLARVHRARVDVPPAAVSAMDGYAVNSAHVRPGDWLEVSQRAPAGQAPEALKPGTAARIFTGSVIPSGADAVAIQENCETRDGEVKLLQSARPGANVRARGQDLQQGQDILGSGHFLRGQDMGLLAAGGVERVSVFRRLRVAVLCSGDELVEPGQPLEPGQIYNANGFTLHGLLSSLAVEPRHYPRIPDRLAATEEALQNAAAECDVLISTGGVSVGEEDHIRQAVTNLGELDLWKLRIKPGKPLAFGRVGSTPFFGLPGNPVAAFVTFLLLVRPFLLRRQGHSDRPLETRRLPADFAVTRASPRQEYLRVRIENGRLRAFNTQDSGVLSSTSWANGLAIVPPDTCVERGDELEVIPYDHFGGL
ncbi:molybdopterin molybdotransferase MoeA [Gilvimarinus sp. F26214L]|uniref:molybdopterin molybdotransferase MoeA n=1 Tax=Gilvimarinus sp. DZF01 TaxID=3461371 RepID=UPI004046611B